MIKLGDRNERLLRKDCKGERGVNPISILYTRFSFLKYHFPTLIYQNPRTCSATATQVRERSLIIGGGGPVNLGGGPEFLGSHLGRVICFLAHAKGG